MCIDIYPLNMYKAAKKNMTHVFQDANGRDAIICIQDDVICIGLKTSLIEQLVWIQISDAIKIKEVLQNFIKIKSKQDACEWKNNWIEFYDALDHSCTIQMNGDGLLIGNTDSDAIIKVENDHIEKHILPLLYIFIKQFND